MTPVVDDHLLRDALASEGSFGLSGIAPDGIATTCLWLFRPCASLERPTVANKLCAPVAVSAREPAIETYEGGAKNSSAMPSGSRKDNPDP
jgi:hypothetical protein